MSRAIQIGGYTVELSNPDKLYFPDDGITKGELVDYYRRVADIMLPHVMDRPLTLHRFPNGIREEGFYQQNASDYFPGWITRVTVEKEGGQTTHVVADKAATLVYLANQGCITLHAWLSRTDRLDTPDRLIFDLDPSRPNLPRLRQAVRQVRDLLDDLGLVPFLMSTGSAGFHVIAPLIRAETFDAVRDVAQAAAERLVQHDPKLFTTEQRKNKRGGKIYIDTLRNSYAHTGVAPYSVRAKPGAPVATPLDWDELDEAHPQQYTIRNLFDRLDRVGDPWHAIGEQARSLSEAQQRLAR